MSRYQDKSVEEIRPIVEKYLERFKARTGKTPDVTSISEKLIKMAEDKEEKEFVNTFESLTPHSLRLAALCAKEGAEPWPGPEVSSLKNDPVGQFIEDVKAAEKSQDLNTMGEMAANSPDLPKKRGRPRKGT